MRHRILCLALALFFCASLIACEQGGQRTLFVSADLATCPNPGHGACLQVRFDPTARWQPLSGTIAGFDHEEGYAYELLVEPADPGASADQLALVEVISKRFVRAASAGTRLAPPEAALTPDPLQTRVWILEAMGAADAPGDLLPGTRITALFGANGRVMGSAGCHSYLADCSWDQDTLNVSDLEMVGSHCAWALQDQGETFAAILRSAVGYRIQGDQLVIRGRDGRDVLSFRSAHAGEIGALSTGDPPFLTMVELLNAEYPMQGATVRLANGQWGEQPLPDGTRIPGIILRRVAFGDLDGDGAQDAAIELLDAYTRDVGAAYVVAVLNRDGHPSPVASRALGAPALVDGLRIEDGRIEVTLLADPLGGGIWCCPQREQLFGFQLVDMELVALTPVVTAEEGQPTLVGHTWRLAGHGVPGSLAAPGADLLVWFDDDESLTILFDDQVYAGIYQACGDVLCISRTAPEWRALNAGVADGERRDLLCLLERAERFSVSADELRVRTRDSQVLLFSPLIVPE